MAKLFQEADFYEKELNDMYSDQNMEELEESIRELERMKEDTFRFRETIGAAIVWYFLHSINWYNFLQEEEVFIFYYFFYTL